MGCGSSRKRWTLDIQHQLPKDIVVELGYIGNHAVHLTTNYNFGSMPAQYLSTLRSSRARASKLWPRRAAITTAGSAPGHSPPSRRTASWCFTGMHPVFHLRLLANTVRYLTE